MREFAETAAGILCLIVVMVVPGLGLALFVGAAVYALWSNRR